MTEIVQLPEKTYYGLSLRTDNATEMRGEGKIGKTWQRFYQEIFPILPSEAVIGAIYHDYASDKDGEYSLLISSDSQSGDSAALLRAGTYRHFRQDGEMPQAAIKLWQQIWAYYADNQQEKRLYITDLEQYDATGVSIYIGIEN